MRSTPIIVCPKSGTIPTSTFPYVVAALVLALLAGIPVPLEASPGEPGTGTPARAGEGTPPGTTLHPAIEHLGRDLPLTFVENRGQWPDHVGFVLSRGGALARLESDSLWLQRNGGSESCAVRLSFTGSARARLEGESPADSTYNFFHGSDASRWKSDVPAFASVVYRGLYPGIDVRVHSSQGFLEYDLLVAPGADPAAVRVRCEGASALRLDEAGGLILDTVAGAIRQMPPLAHRETPDGTSSPVPARFVLHDEFTYGFAIPPLPADSRVVIDPGIEWSTFLGDSGYDFPRDVKVNQHGTIIVVGETSSLRFPTTPGAFDRQVGGKAEVFVTALTPDGSRIRFSTLLGGSSADLVHDVLLDEENGGMILVGETVSPDFPTTPDAIDRTRDGDTDGFVVKLSTAGNRLTYGTLLGGSSDDRVRAAAMTDRREVIVAGETTSRDFSTGTGVVSPNPLGGRDVFVVSLRAAGDTSGDELLFGTYLGGARDDTVTDLAWSRDTGITVVGMTFSSNLPTTPGAIQTTAGGKGDGYLVCLRDDGGAVLYSTYLGGRGNDGIQAMDFGPAGEIVVTGLTWSPDFPITAGSHQVVHRGGVEVFVTALLPLGLGNRDIQWSTLLGGNKLEYAYDVAVDEAGGITLVGMTVSNNFPTTPDAFSRTPIGHRGSDGWIARLAPGGTGLVFSSYFGGQLLDAIEAVALDGPDHVVIAGQTLSGSDLPVTPQAFDPTFGGAWDVFLTRIALPATPGR